MNDKKEQYINQLLDEFLKAHSAELLSEFSRDDLKEIMIAHQLKANGKMKEANKEFVHILHSSLLAQHARQYNHHTKEKKISWFSVAFPATVMVLLIAIISIGFFQFDTYITNKPAESEQIVFNFDKELSDIETIVLDQENELAFLDTDIGMYEDSYNGMFHEFESDLDLVLE